MILRIHGIEHDIQFIPNMINILEIHDKILFRNVLRKMNDYINQEEYILKDNEIVLLDDNNELLKIADNMLMITDIYNINFNDKKIISTVYNIIDQNLQNNVNLELYNNLLQLREQIITEVNELPIEFIIKKEIDIKDLLKAFNVKIDAQLYYDLKKKLYYFIDVISTLNINKILILTNLKIYLTEEELIEFYKYVIYNNIKLLIIENIKNDKIMYENKNVITQNFEDFTI